MFARILVPVDGSVFAEQALPLALSIAARAQAELLLVLVHGLPPVPELRESVYESQFTLTLPFAEQNYLTDLAHRIREATGIEAETALLSGSPVKTLYTYVRRHDVDLVVMSTHGRGGVQRAWLGSVADGLVRRLPVPVLLVRPRDEKSTELDAAAVRRILVALDGSDVADACIPVAAELASLLDAETTLLRVVIPPSALMPVRVFEPALDQQYTDAARHEAEAYLAERTSHFTPRAESVVVVDAHAATAVLEQAVETAADLIVVGTRGYGRIARLVLGSVADKVVRASAVPVLVSPCPRERRTAVGAHRSAEPATADTTA